MAEEKVDCSRCGACLNSCAVYQLLLEEAASPRGRLATLAALREGRLEDKPENRRFIEACMLCGRCEVVCNKGVKGREEIMAQRLLWRQEKKGSWWKRLLTRFYGPKLLRLVRPFFGLIALSPLRKRLLLPVSGGPAVKRGKKRHQLPSDIGLFPGCVLGVFYPQLLQHIEVLLNKSGVMAHVLWEADCCGFPALSQGDLISFNKKRLRNEALFKKKGIKTLIVPCATGVMAMRAHYSGEFVIEELGNYFLSVLSTPDIVRKDVLNSADGFWLYHRPCHQPKRDESGGWLKAISDCPAIRMPMREETDCCGFGGLFSIGFPSLSRQILHDRQEKWRQDGVGGVITDCPGCYLQFKELGTLPVLFFTELFCDW